jgi:hypothetical protein
VRPPPQRSQLHLTRQARAASLRRRQTPAQYPISWIHQHRRRLPVFGAGSSAEADSHRFASAARNARPMWGPAGTLPRRCRHGAFPTDPARQETPGTIGTQSMPIGFASQHGLLPTMHPRNPEGSLWRPQPRTKYRQKTSNIGVSSRRIERVATLAAEQHVTARRRNRALPGHGSCGSKPALSDHQPRSAASTQAPTPTVACATSGCTRPFTHMTSEPVMLPPPPRRSIV